MSSLPPTPGQTIGPWFGYGLPYAGGPELVPAHRTDAIRLHGYVLDGAGNPIPDAMLELWQLAPDGTVVQEQGSLQRDGWTFTGFGRCPTDSSGHYSFSTLLPGAEDGKAPFFAVTLFARGLLDRLFTRVYLPGAALDSDPLLESLPAEQRRTLVAAEDETGYRFDIRMQGEDETVFLTFGG